MSYVRDCISVDEMDRADSELKETIKNIWPMQAKKTIDLLVPPHERKAFTHSDRKIRVVMFADSFFLFVGAELNAGQLTVGKIYAGLQILECWKTTKFKKTDNGPPVSRVIYRFYPYYVMVSALYRYCVVICLRCWWRSKQRRGFHGGLVMFTKLRQPYESDDLLTTLSRLFCCLQWTRVSYCPETELQSWWIWRSLAEDDFMKWDRIESILD